MLFRNEILYIDNAIGLGYNKYNGQKYVYRKNLQGDIVAILDECGCTRGTYEYDAWGKIIWQGGSELLTINPFRYRGYYYDEETGLYYLNSRYYDPETGRFISPDSLDYLEPETCNGLNLYAYCGNNPVMFVDPNGCFAISTFIIGLLATVGGLTIAGAAIGGISAAIHRENILTGIRNGAIAGLLFGMSAALVATGVGTPLAGGFIGTLMVGMGVGSAYVLGSSLNSQLQGKGFGRIEIGKRGGLHMHFIINRIIELYFHGKTSDKKHRFQPNVVSKYRKTIDLLESLSVVEDLFRFKSLHYEALVGDKAGIESVRVNDQYRIEFKTTRVVSEVVVTVCNILELSNHYK